MQQISSMWLVIVQWALAFEWLHSSWGKWAQPGFIANIQKTLTGFANGTNFHFYANFLNSVAIPHAALFGNLIRIGEASVGIAFALGGIIWIYKYSLPKFLALILAVACLAAALMNLNFFLASGWSSPAGWGLNILMIALELLLASFYIKQVKSNDYKVLQNMSTK